MTVMVRVSTSVSVPPVPVLPPSLVVIVRVTDPFIFTTGTKTGADAPARNALISASSPERTSVPVPDPLTVTPPAVAAVKIPLVTLSETLTAPEPASTSAMASPDRMSDTSSLVL